MDSKKSQRNSKRREYFNSSGRQTDTGNNSTNKHSTSAVAAHCSKVDDSVQSKDWRVFYLVLKDVVTV